MTLPGSNLPATLDVRWDGITHQESYNAVQQGPGAAASAAAETRWSSTKDLILGVNDRITRAVSQSTSGYGGTAADAARGVISRLGQWAVDAADRATGTVQVVRATRR